MKRLLIALAATTALTAPVITVQAVQAATSPSPGGAQMNLPQNGTTQPQSNGAGQPQTPGSMAAPISPDQLSQHQVEQIQIALNKNGFDAGEVDGVWGPHTDTALMDFQKSKGMQATGQLDQKTLGALNVNLQVAQATGMQGQTTPAQAMAQTQPVSPASLSTSQIRKIQTALNRPGYDIDRVDGIWGPDTEQAVRIFQRRHDLAATGQLDQKTLSALNVNLQVAQTSGTPSQTTQGQAMAQAQPISPASISRSDIRNVQMALNNKGFGAGEVDGIWGPNTSEAVKDFQQKQGLSASGYLNQQTISALGVNVAALSPSQQGNSSQAKTLANNQTPPSKANQNLASNMSPSQKVPGQNAASPNAASQNAGQTVAANASPTGTKQNKAAKTSPSQVAQAQNTGGQNMTVKGSAQAGAAQIQMAAQQPGQPNMTTVSSAKVSLAEAAATAEKKLQNGRIFAISLDGSANPPVYHVEAYLPAKNAVWTADINANTDQMIGTPSQGSKAQLSQSEMKAINALSPSSQPISNVIGTAQKQGAGTAIEAQLQQVNGAPGYVVTLAKNGSTQKITVKAQAG